MKLFRQFPHKRNHSHGFIVHCCLLFVVCSFAFIVSCARMGTPDGGPYDETPPKVVHTSPRFGTANTKNVKKIVIEFDEMVKIDNAMEKVVISPPQIEQPEIEAVGKKVTITLLDSLKPNTTYTIDFADAIVDNNEGNPYGDYAFTFSTGERVDTFQMSGNVLDASNLEPIKGMLVGLYKVSDDAEGDSIHELPDSIFHTTPFERISRTDSRGHFVVKGLAPGCYRAFALKDQNQNYIYDQRAEKVAFSERILSTSSKPDIRPDTVWHDSIHYDSIVMTPYTHFYPDDIMLLAFDSSIQNRYKLKEERTIPQFFTLYFTAPSDTLPLLTGLNFKAEDAFVVDANQHKDTINYWIRDSLIYNLDTLEVKLDFYATDTTGNLALTTDTMMLVSKLTKEKIAKQEQQKYEEWVKECKQKAKEARRQARRKSADEVPPEKEGGDISPTDSIPLAPTSSPSFSTEKVKGSKKKKKDDDEDIEIPPMPEEFLEFKINGVQSLTPDRNIDFEFNEPLDSVDLSKIHLSIQVDSLFQPAPFLFRQLHDKIRTYRLYAEWEPDTTYRLDIDTAAFVNIYGKRNEAQKRTIRLQSLNNYSTLFVTLQKADPSAIVELLDGNDKVVKSIKAPQGKADFYFITPGTYYLRLFYDLNGNEIWDTGDYDSHLQPEPVYYYPNALALKAQWEISQTWNPTALSLAQQKPLKITKQKPDKEKSIKKKNEERERNKKK